MGLLTIRSIKARQPKVKVVVFTQSTSSKDMLGAITNGADGYLLKDSRGETLLRELEAVMLSGTVFSPAPSPPPFQTLTSREVTVLEMACYSAKEAGARLFITSNTVKYHVGGIRRRLLLTNRAEYITWAAGHVPLA